MITELLPTPLEEMEDITGFPPQHAPVMEWVNEMVALCQPTHLYWCEGSAEQKAELTRRAVAEGVLTPLNQEKRPGCYYHRSNPNDVARVEECTFICTKNPKDAGPTNHWSAPAAMVRKLHAVP